MNYDVIQFIFFKYLTSNEIKKMEILLNIKYDKNEHYYIFKNYNCIITYKDDILIKKEYLYKNKNKWIKYNYSNLPFWSKTKWYKNGKYRSKENYENENKNGIQKYYNENGKIKKILCYINGIYYKEIK
jgi:hypothetical protein